jgi:hypothetical protein
MTWPMPDMPKRVSYAYLEKLDAQPGYCASAKLNGECLCIHCDAGHFELSGKGGEKRKPLSPALIRWVQRVLCDYDGLSVQCELIGPRLDYLGDMPMPRIVVVDCLRWSGLWLRALGFVKRIGVLQDHGIPHLEYVESPRMCELFQAQLTDPVSEGVVVRRSSSGLVLHDDVCKERDGFYKVKFRG